LFEDRDKTIWIGTYLKGISKINPLEQKFQHTNHVTIDGDLHQFSLTSCFVEDKEGNLWIGSDGEGLFYWDKNQNQYRHYGSSGKNSAISSDIIVALLIDKKENLWVGTWNGGVNILPKDQTSFKRWNAKNSEGKAALDFDIFEFMEDRKGRIWVSTFRDGIKIYLPERDEFVSFGEGQDKWKLGKGKIRSLAEDRQGNIWIGTEANGLHKLSINDKLEILDSKTFFSEGSGEFAVVMINDMFLDNTNNLWVATSGSGLVQIDTRTDALRRFAKAEGLPSNMLYSIQEDNEENIWASTNAGIFSLNMKSHEVNTYTQVDGLQSNAFCKSSALKSQDGTLYFGGINGFNAFNPKQLRLNSQKPEVYITSLEVGDKPFPFEASGQSQSILNDHQVKLKHHQNDFTLEFIALNYLQAARNQYEYQLENYDETWRSVGADKLAQYTNVPPGTYTFRVRASNNDGLWNERGAQIFIHIQKPWYATYFAYALYALFVLGLLIWARQNIISRERLRNELNLEQLERAKVQEINQVKTRFFANISHEFKTPLTLIMSPLQVLINKTKTDSEEGKSYDLIRRNAERLYRLINQILDLSMMDAGAIKLQTTENDLSSFLRQIVTNFSPYADECFINYEVNIPDKEFPIYFDKDKMEKVFVNILSNAFKFTPAQGTIAVSLLEAADQVIVKITDTGKGINPEVGQTHQT
jgi:signal transduction histidine kinase/streptogramin lyase